MARPVASAAWTIRGTEWAPSRVKSRSPPVVREKGTRASFEEDLLDDPRPLAREELDRLGVAEAGAGPEDVADERRGRVVLPEVDDAALGPAGVAVRRVCGLREDEDLHAAPGEGEGRRETGDARAEDEDGDAEPAGERPVSSSTAT